ncbi:hypothetical protein MGWOODY_Smn3487 [hydrothermal vent metagenome]|uniref:Uncharacterized protein n=1 Tax=hydrothermal vent metagenome TaxID=652676 RepID=A0A160TH36_9ZZZZ
MVNNRLHWRGNRGRAQTEGIAAANEVFGRDDRSAGADRKRVPAGAARE